MNEALLCALSRITPEEQSLLAGGRLDKKLYTDGAGFQVDSKRMLQRGRLIDIRPHTRFTAFPPHNHDYVEILYMCQGSTTHLINGETTLILKQGELLLLNQHTVHAIEPAGATDIAVNFIVLPAFFDDALILIGGDNVLGQFLISSLSQDGESGFLHFQVAEVLVIQNLVENLIWSLAHKQQNNRRINQVTMGLLFLQLLNHVELSRVSGGRTHGLVMEALREIEENYRCANLSLVAERFGVSLAYLSQLIRKTTGSSFKMLLKEKRLAKAAQLLRSTSLTVAEIILAVGYDNSSYFYRIFSEKYRCVPKDYRTKNQTDEVK